MVNNVWNNAEKMVHMYVKHINQPKFTEAKSIYNVSTKLSKEKGPN